MLPLIGFTATENNIAMTELLLEHGADINMEASTGDTPLMLAITFNAHDVIKFLLDHGADTTVVNKGGATALDYARYMKNERVIMILEAKDAMSRVVARML